MYIMTTDNISDGRFENPILLPNYSSIPETLTLEYNENYSKEKTEVTIKKTTSGYLISQNDYYLCAKDGSNLSLETAYKTNGIWSIENLNTNYYRLLVKTNNNINFNFNKDSEKFYVSKSNTLGPNLYRKDHTINIGNTHFATYYNGKWDSKVPEGVTAYTFIINDTGQNIKLNKTHEYKSGEIIPAGSPVILYSEGENDYVIELSSPNNSLPKYENALKGTDSDYLVTTSESQTYYILSLNENNETNSIGFYPIENFTNTAHKAYLPVNKTLESKPLYFSLDFINSNTSKVNTHPYENMDYNKTYNVTGQLCNPNHHGIIIRNGKKYIK